MNRNELLALSATIKNETAENANTANRIGGTLEEIVNSSVIISEIEQAPGQSLSKVMSQKSVTDQLALKIDKTQVKQTTGNSQTDLMSQYIISQEFDSRYKKTESDSRYFIKSAIVNDAVVLVQGGEFIDSGIRINNVMDDSVYLRTAASHLMNGGGLYLGENAVSLTSKNDADGLYINTAGGFVMINTLGSTLLSSDDEGLGNVMLSNPKVALMIINNDGLNTFVRGSNKVELLSGGTKLSVGNVYTDLGGYLHTFVLEDSDGNRILDYDYDGGQLNINTTTSFLYTAYFQEKVIVNELTSKTGRRLIDGSANKLVLGTGYDANKILESAAGKITIGPANFANHSLVFDENDVDDNNVRLSSRGNLLLSAESMATLTSAYGNVFVEAGSEIYINATYSANMAGQTVNINGAEEVHVESAYYIDIASETVYIHGYSDVSVANNYGSVIGLYSDGGISIGNGDQQIELSSMDGAIRIGVSGSGDNIFINGYANFDQNRAINNANFNSMKVSGGIFSGYGTAERVLISNTLGNVKAMTKAEFNAWLNS